MAKDFYSKICDVDPNQRYTANKALKHPWITRERNGIVPISYLEDMKRREGMRNMQMIIGIVLLIKNFPEKKEEYIIDKAYKEKIEKVSLDKSNQLKELTEKCLGNYFI